MRSAILSGLGAAFLTVPVAFFALATLGVGVGATMLLTPFAALAAFVVVSGAAMNTARREAREAREADMAIWQQRWTLAMQQVPPEALLREVWTLDEIEMDGRR